MENCMKIRKNVGLDKGKSRPQSRKIYVKKKNEEENKIPLEKESESHGLDGTSRNFAPSVELFNATTKASIDATPP